MLPPGQQRAAASKWPIVGERSAGAGPAEWTIELAGLVEKPSQISLDRLRALPQAAISVDVHCVTRWSKPAMRFGGVPLASLLAPCQPKPQARFVSFIARSDRGHSTSLPLADALQLGAMAALTHQGQPLPAEHGGPVRLVVPGRYFYKSLKWLRRVELLAEDRLGYWEAHAGYHNVADPLREQRFVAPSITRAQALQLISSNDISGRELLGVDLSGRRLDGLSAEGAVLRAADFRGASLVGAVFDGANLSNANFQNADLRTASLRRADVEGANFAGADLDGADFRSASLVAATFLEGGIARPLAARITAITRFDEQSLGDLMPAQEQFVRAAWNIGD